MLRSSFEVISNYPVQCAWDKWNKEKGVDAAAWYVIGMFALPLSALLTPLTIVIDVVRGAALALFALISRRSTLSPKTVAWNLMIASPLQQLTTLAITLLSLYPFGHTGIFGWHIIKNASEFAVSSLPRSINHRQFSIFRRKTTLRLA